MSNVVNAAMHPKTANATDSGLIDCSASASTTEVTWK